MSYFDDDGLEPPSWVNSGRSRADDAPPLRPAARTRTATTSERRRPDRGADGLVRQTFDDDTRSEAEAQPPRRQRVARRETQRSDRRRRRRTLIVLAVVVLPIVLVLAAGGWFLYELNPPGGPGRKISVTIPEHAGTPRIGDLLEDKGVIGSSTAFQVFTKVTRAGPFKPGQYSMREGLGVRGAVDKLNAGPAPEAKLVLPPGLTVGQLADRVGALPGHQKDAFTAALQSNAVRSKYQPPEVTSLEGVLFPDSYFVKKGETDEQLLARMVASFDQQADGAGLAAANTSGLNPYQTVIVASLIEREAKLDEDRPLIAAVIRNRLLAGKPLQIDATVCYAKGGCDKAPTKADLEIDSPYNTYKIGGLPPTPISTVSVQSLMAAAHPADVPYMYYVLADKNGKHKFATTEQEHNLNVEEARQKGLL